MIIVSGYYTIPSKKSKEFYYGHIQRFFKKLTWQKIIFFTDQENFLSLRHFARSNVQFVLQNFNDLPVFQDFSEEFWKEQMKSNPEQYQTWQLGAIWASKSYFIRRASELSHDEWFVWVDAGCVRTEDWNLNNFTRRNTFSDPGVYVQLLHALPSKDLFELPDVFIAGSHILFHRSKIDFYIESYKENINKYIQNKKCIINDQYVIASMCKDSSFLKLVSYNVSCPDKWFFFFSII